MTNAGQLDGLDLDIIKVVEPRKPNELRQRTELSLSRVN